MERINPFVFYKLSQVLQNLVHHEGDVPFVDIFFKLIEARSVLKSLIDGKPIPIDISKGSATKLLAQIEEILQELRSTKDDDGKPQAIQLDGIVPGWRLNYLKSLLNTFETVLGEEMREAAAYYVPRRGIFHTPALVDTAEETFPAEVLSYIPQKTRDEWRAAGRCLAFNLLSASGFHVARAVEGTLEAYHAFFVPNAKKCLRTWNDYITDLESVSGPGPVPRSKTLAELRQMKDDYRNPIMHPRVVLGESDAKMLFNNGESLIIAMAQELAEAADKAQPALALVQPNKAQSP